MFAATTIGLACWLLSPDTMRKESVEGLKPLRGCWYLLWTADQRRTSPGDPRSRMEIGGDGRVVFKFEEAVTNRGRFAVLSSGSLGTIDLKLTSGETLFGVYELKDDELTVCFAEAGRPRPASVKPRGQQWSERWKRERL